MRMPGTTFSCFEALLAVVIAVLYVGVGCFLGEYYYNQHLASEKRPTGAVTKEDFPNGHIPNLNVTIFILADCLDEDTKGNMSWAVPESGVDYIVMGANLSFQRIERSKVKDPGHCLAMASLMLPFSFQVTNSPIAHHKTVLGVMGDVAFEEYYCRDAFGPWWSICSRDLRFFHVGKMDLMTGYETKAPAGGGPESPVELYILPYALSTSEVQKFVDSWPENMCVGTYDACIDIESILAPSFPEGAFVTGGRNYKSGTMLKFSLKRTTTIRAGPGWLSGLFGEVQEDVMTTSVGVMPSGTSGIILTVDPQLSQETFAVQITLMNALTSWFTILHTILTICLFLFPTSPKVPRYFTFGIWGGRYTAKLHAMGAGAAHEGESLRTYPG